jgi:TetR/AcrR family transcriptional regulator, transcriptional repressor for nem operon
MRKSRKETAETRQRIIEAAATEFRRDGIVGTGLADFMASAGLTHGGFYKHFESKDEVVRESLELAAATWIDSMESTLSRSSGARKLSGAITTYLSLKHRDDVGDGCPFVALGSELARGSNAVRETATCGIEKLIDLIAAELHDMPPAAARKQAQVMLATMIGAMTMARMVTDPDLSASILRQARKSLTGQ